MQVSNEKQTEANAPVFSFVWDNSIHCLLHKGDEVRVRHHYRGRSEGGAWYTMGAYNPKFYIYVEFWAASSTDMSFERG